MTRAEPRAGDPAGDGADGLSLEPVLSQAAHASATSAAFSNTHGMLAPAAPKTEHSGTLTSTLYSPPVCTTPELKQNERAADTRCGGRVTVGSRLALLGGLGILVQPLTRGGERGVGGLGRGAAPLSTEASHQ